jgi:3-deoxy-7-phosphoheptulonate synthase
MTARSIGSLHEALAVEVPSTGVWFGGSAPVQVIAGPCSVEGRSQFRDAAVAVSEAGAALLRGGAFKPRTSPYSFQGLGREGLEIMREVAEDIGIGIVTEVMSVDDTAMVASYADVLQIGARNMDNRALLERVADTGKPILLKRGGTATIGELLDAAERIVARGNPSVILCERGSRTFEPSTRNSLDIGAVAELKERNDFPVVVDPSHGTGRRDLVTPVSEAAVAAGADGLLVEVHPRPEEALSDGSQSLVAAEFGAYMDRVKTMAYAVGRSI